MRMRSLLLFLFVGFAAPAWALTFVQMPDQALLDQAATVLEGEIVGTVPFTKPPRSYTVYRVDVSQYLKGVGAAEVEVWVPGSVEPDHGALGEALVVPGAPSFAAGDQVLLFLNPRQAGGYAITQSALGTFYRRNSGTGEPLARRQLESAFELPGAGVGALLPAADQARDWTLFTTWLALAAAGVETPPSYWRASVPGDRPVRANFTTLGTPPGRWFQFDANQSVTLRAHSSGQTGLPGGGFSQFQTGIGAWNADAGSNIRYVYGGTTSATGGLCTSDGVNAILFNDANRDPDCDVEGTFSCSSGGVIASGGFRTSGTGVHEGSLYARIVEGDIVINDNAGCFLAADGGINAAEIFGHELGHTLGLGHSCGDTEIAIGIPDCVLTPAADDALMRAFPHEDGRGADLRADDEAGVATLYGASSTGGGGGDGGGSGGGGGRTFVDDDGGGGGAVDVFIIFLLALLLGDRRRCVRAG